MFVSFMNGKLTVAEGSNYISTVVTQEQANHIATLTDFTAIQNYLMHSSGGTSTSLETIGITIKNGLCYWDSPNAIPESLVTEIRKYLEANESVEPLKNFWMWLQLNPSSTSRQSLFDFIKHNNVELTPNGMLITYRNMKFKCFESYTELKSLLGSAFKSLSQSPSALINIKGETIRAQDFVNNPEQYVPIIMTDEYSKTMSYRIGQIARIDRELCNPDPYTTCGAGLHVGSQEFLASGYFGDEGLSVVCLVNPMHVVACAHNEYGKLRVCEFKPIQFAPNEGRVDTRFINRESIDYYAECEEDVLEQADDWDIHTIPQLVKETVNVEEKPVTKSWTSHHT
jgi:hypothetical protein